RPVRSGNGRVRAVVTLTSTPIAATSRSVAWRKYSSDSGRYRPMPRASTATASSSAQCRRRAVRLLSAAVLPGTLYTALFRPAADSHSAGGGAQARFGARRPGGTAAQRVAAGSADG